LSVIASLNADLDGDGQEETVQSTDDNHTIVLRNGVVLWDHEGWIQGWNRRSSDAFLAADVDHDGHQEVVIWNNPDGWTGVLKWQAGALVLPWAAPSPLHGPAGQWNRRPSDEFAATAYNNQVAVSVAHPEDGWHGILLWETNALQPVLITQATVSVPQAAGYSLNDGIDRITAAGLTIGVFPQPGPPPDNPLITDQQPDAGTVVARGTEVILYIQPDQ
jgi:PASTA domain